MYTYIIVQHGMRRFLSCAIRAYSY